MWYKHFNKDSWKLRLWRHKNLTFKYNDLGFSSLHYASTFRNGVLRVFGHEGPLRTFNLFFVVFIGSFYGYYNEKFFGEKQRQKAKIEEEKKKAEDIE